MHVVRRLVKGGPARHPPALRLWRCTKGGAPSTVGHRGRAQIFRRRPNLMGGPGVLWTPGRRPPHRNGGARRLSGYAAKSRSDAPTGGARAQASPLPCFRPPYRRPMQKGWGLALPLYSHERTTIIREVGKKMAAKLSRQVSCTATPARPIKRKCSAGGAGGCGDSRKVTAPGRPASRFWQRRRWGGGRGCPRSCKRKGYGDAPCAPARLRWAGADAVEKAPRNDTVWGVQGSFGPLVGGRRIETAGPLVLSVMKEQHSNEILAKRWP